MTSAASRCTRTSMRSRSCRATRTSSSSAPTAASSARAASGPTRRQPVRHAAVSRRPYLADCHTWLKRIPTELKVMNAGLGDAADEQHLRQPVHAGHGDGRHRRTTARSRSRARRVVPAAHRRRRRQRLRRHRPAPPLPQVHGRADGRELQRRRSDVVALGRRLVHRRLPRGARASTRRCSPTRSSTKTIFVGAQRVWRTQNAGGDRAFLEQHCNTAVGEFPSDLLYTGACGTAADWPPLGTRR